MELKPCATACGSKPIQNMLKEKKNVTKSRKVRRVFRINSEGTPSSDEMSSNSRKDAYEVKAEGSSIDYLSGRLRRLIHSNKESKYLGDGQRSNSEELEVWRDLYELKSSGYKQSSGGTERDLERERGLLSAPPDARLRLRSPHHPNLSSEEKGAPLTLPPLKNEVIRGANRKPTSQSTFSLL